jgi:exodeoxyribonuclease V gamma subunit
MLRGGWFRELDFLDIFRNTAECVVALVAGVIFPMSGLYLRTGNRLETLLEELLAVVGKPLSSVLQSEIIVVQSLGMARWLSLELAKQQGICANVRFPFPQRFLSEVFRIALLETPESKDFDRPVMTWRLMNILSKMAERSGFEAVHNYVSGERPELKRFQLAAKITDTFSQYLAFRPQMVLNWEAGQENHWQAILWRELTSQVQGLHQPALGRKLVEMLQHGGSALKQLPSRVSIFGISTLPQFYLVLMEALAEHIEVNLFVMEPTPQWWQDIVSAREEGKMLRRQPNRTAEDLHLERGNTLLASMGKLGRDFLGFVADLDSAIHREFFVEPAGGTMLSSIQKDIFHLRDPGSKAPLSRHDRSIQVHSCHSEMREVEVLHDQLLALLSDCPGLQPQDIVVMMPDVATYASLIEAVFDTPEIQNQRIPYSIADRTARVENGIVDTFLTILEMGSSRFGASSLLNILESPAVQGRFQLTQADLETIRVWIDKVAIRWGIDAAHREKLGLPAFAQNTWREGLDRLLLGYALPGGNCQLFKNILPCDEIEGRLAETLGNFIEFTSRVFETAKELETARTLGGWQATLREVVDRFFDPTEDVEREMLQVRRVLESLGETGAASCFEETVDLDVLLAFLSDAFGSAVSGSGFLQGSVTFCALKPMRSIPFKVIAILGMNDTAYPRKPAMTGFDLIAQNPQPGDRSVRDDDRYLFLEALLSAREVFYTSYVGQSIKDNSPLPPSVLVSELLDYLDRAFEVPHGLWAKESLVTQHRLHPFNVDYFSRSDERLFSYSVDNCRAGEMARSARSQPRMFVSNLIGEPEDEWRTVDLASLIAFFRNPTQFFIKKRLGITLSDGASMLEEREPFALDSLTQYQIEEDLLAKALSGSELQRAIPLILASGRLPHGHYGTTSSRKLCQDMEAFAAIVAAHVHSKPLPPVMIDRAIGDWTLNGRIDGLHETGLACYRPAALQPKDMLKIWIFHLALNCTNRSSSVLIGRESMQVYRPVEDSSVILRDLLTLYWRGLREPLRFFPRSSHAFAKETIEPEGKRDPRTLAEVEWEIERANTYIDLAFRNVSEPLDQDWQDLALKVFAPLLKARTETEL